MNRSYVVTGGGRGIGRALVERLLGDADNVVAIELDPAALAWTGSHPAGPRVIGVVGDAADEAVAEQAADLAQAAGILAGWVNNAAVFRDASLHSAATREMLDLIALNLHPVVVGCATAIRCFLAAGTDWGDRQRLFVPGAAGGPGLPALRDRQGSRRRTDPGAGRRVRVARHPRQRRCAGFDRHRALRGVPPRAGARGGGAD